MNRLRSILAASAMVLLAALPASAEINYHNGMIVFVNATSSKVSVYARHFFGTHSEEVEPGATRVINPCCILAGTRYEIKTYRHAPDPKGGNHYIDVTPHLCNRNGVPFGYAKVVQDEWNWIHEVDKTVCPT